jgi:hypothetical protein
VRYLRCPVDNLPTVAELQLLVPSSAAPGRGPQPAAPPPRDLHAARDTLSTTVASRRAERSALWQDSTLFQDSFFAPDNRLDGFGNSEYSALQPSPGLRPTVAPNGNGTAPYRSLERENDELGGVVVDVSRFSSRSHH